MFLVIDNYDSFVHNLARYFELAGQACRVIRNDALSIGEIRACDPDALILSPGPCSPQEAGICIEAVRQLGAALPILGICLGHQAIGEAYGALTLRADAPMHGKACMIEHDGAGLFQDLPNPMSAGRYHSLIVKPGAHCPLKVTARTPSGEIMGLSHPVHPVYGLQFHPESILTPQGPALIRNFVRIAQAWHGMRKAAA